MLPLRLLGINMADEAADTFGGGIKNYLGAIGFILPLLGGEELIRLYLTGSGLPWPISVAMIAAGLPVYLSPAAWKHAKRLVIKPEQPGGRPLEYLTYEDAELGYAIQMMGWRSAWSKSYAAQYLATNNHRPTDENNMMHAAASLVREDLLNGRLEARGRKPGQLDYEVIPRTHWRSTVPLMVPDPRSLWKMILMPTGGAEFDRDGNLVRADHLPSKERTDQLAGYDSIIVNARQFESMWPRKDKKTDRAKRRLLKKAKRVGADPAEIEKLARD